MAAPIICTQGLTKWYGRHRGLLDLDLGVEAGEVFGYLGPNGAGKSTTIRLLLDLIRPSGGSVRLFGLDSRRDSLAIRRRVGYLPGDLRLYDSVSGRELLGFFGRLRGGVDAGRVRDLADRLDCDLGREIRTLSHGNRQKLGLIQTLMNDPDLLILDEPTNGLDPLVQRTFYALVDEARARGQTVFVSSHVLSEVERICGRVAIIRDGRLLALEGVADLKARAVRHVEIRFAAAVPRAPFDGLPGVDELTVEGATLRCATRGSLDPLLKAANRFEIHDLLSQEPTLEEIVLAYYAGPAAVEPPVGDATGAGHAA